MRRLRLVSAGSARVRSTAAPAPQLAAGERIGATPFLSATEFARGAERFADNLDALVDAAAQHAVPIVLMTQVENVRDFPPCYS